MVWDVVGVKLKKSIDGEENEVTVASAVNVGDTRDDDDGNVDCEKMVEEGLPVEAKETLNLGVYDGIELGEEIVNEELKEVVPRKWEGETEVDIVPANGESDATGTVENVKRELKLPKPSR